jgi:hypothetical protein
LKEDVVDLRTVPGFPGYVVDGAGRVLSLRRQRPLVVRIGSDGYLHVSLLRREGGRLRHYRRPLHRVVCAAHTRRPLSTPLDVDHKDGNRLNCRPGNLQWTTRKVNLQLARNRVSGGVSWSQGERNTSARLTVAGVQDIRARIARGECQRAIAASYGVTAAAITDIKKGRTWRHVPA